MRHLRFVSQNEYEIPIPRGEKIFEKKLNLNQNVSPMYFLKMCEVRVKAYNE